MVFFDLRTSRSYITAHRPAQLAQIKSGYSFGPRVTSQQQRAVVSAQPMPRLVPSTSSSTFAKRSWRFLARELENVWLFRHCTYLQVTYFFQIKFTFWHKIQQIDLNFCFDMKIVTNLFEFEFWQGSIHIWRQMFFGHFWPTYLPSSDTLLLNRLCK